MASAGLHVRWKCYAKIDNVRCQASGTIAQLHNTKLDELDTAVSSGHERRAKECHKRNGVSKIRGLMNGLTVRFPLVPSIRPENVAPESPITPDLEASHTPAPSTAT